MPTLLRPLTRRLERPMTLGLPSRLRRNVYEDGIHLDFVRNRHYIKAPGRPAQEAPLTSLFSFTGDNQSRYRGAAGLLVPSITNTPRIEYDGNGNCLGLLVEGTRTNLILQSENLTTTWGTFGASIVANQITAPDGTLTADFIREDSSVGSTHGATQSPVLAASTTYTKSHFLKAGTRTWAFMQTKTPDNVFRNAYFDLVNGVVGNVSGCTATMQQFIDGWWRCSITHTGGVSAAAANNEGVFAAAGNNQSSYNGDGVSGIYAWGGQHEVGAVASSYIPTTTGSVTRAADVCRRTFGSEFNLTAGTAFAQFDLLLPNTSSSQFVLSTNGNGRLLYNPSGAVTVGIFDGTTAATAGTLTANVMSRAASGYDATLGMTIYSSTSPTPTSAAFDGSMVGASDIGLGQSGAGGNEMFGHIRRLDYWPERLPNDVLQRMTA